METRTPPTPGPAGDPGTPPEASALVAACEEAWRAIQAHHPEVPHPVIILGSGVERGRLVKLGHWSTGRWVADGELAGEVLLAGEALNLPAPDVFEVLLHEAAHGLNAARHVRDTSRGGRYHNRRFKTTAEELGLDVTAMPPYGLAKTTLGRTARERYGDEIETIADAMRIVRQLSRHTKAPGAGTPDTDTGGNRAGSIRPAVCGCGRRMRMAPSVLELGPVLCGLCNETFSTEPRTTTPTNPTHAAQPADATVETISTFQSRELAELTRLDLDPQHAEQLTRVAYWYGQRNTDRPEPLAASDAADLVALHRAARRMLILDGTLHEPTINVGDREFAVGEHIVLGTHPIDTTGRDRQRLPPAGVFGIVEAIDTTRRELHVDFAITGKHRIGVDTAAGQSLDYGYAELGTEITRRAPVEAVAVRGRAAVEPGFEIEP